MSLKLPNDKIVYNLPEQVGVNTENIAYLAKVYKEIDSIPAQYAELKADYEDNIKAYFDDTMKPTFAGWTTTFEGWTSSLDTYLANMSSAALGAIAGGTVPGNLSINGDFTANSIIENMNGYAFATPYTNVMAQALHIDYAGVVKNGNKVTFAVAGYINVGENAIPTDAYTVFQFTIPSAVGSKLFPMDTGHVSYKSLIFFRNYGSTISGASIVAKNSNTNIYIYFYNNSSLSANTKYYFRYEETFLLSDNLAS